MTIRLCTVSVITLAITYLIIYLHFAVRYKDLLDDPYADVCKLLKSCGNVCAIIYCLERTMCDDLAIHITSSGISCAGNEWFS